MLVHWHGSWPICNAMHVAVAQNTQMPSWSSLMHTLTDSHGACRSELTALLAHWRDLHWRRSTLRAAVARLQQGTLARALTQWQRIVAHKGALQARLQPILEQWRNVRLRSGFNAFLLKVGWPTFTGRVAL